MPADSALPHGCKGLTALSWAVGGCHVTTVRLLLGLGADPTAEANPGHTVLAAAQEFHKVSPGAPA